MTDKKLNFISNLFFDLFILSGVLYTIFLVVAIRKVVPGFTMNLIFLIDALKYNNFDNNIFNLFFSRIFLVNILSGGILSFLIFKYVKAFIKIIKSLGETHRFISGLNIVKINSRYLTFSSTNDFIFTAGFFRPKIFVASELFKSHNSDEIEAMLLHEENHQKNLHPFKVLIANFIDSIYPNFPGKKWVVNNYITITEVSSDKFAENKINNKIPLVSALLKLQQTTFKQFPLASISYFNSQSERIKILVGQKILPTKQPIALYSMVVIAVVFSTFLLKNSNIFFDCQHLLKCFEILVTPNSQQLIISSTPINNSFVISDHCQ